MDPVQLLNQDNLKDALEMAKSVVRSQPTNNEARGLLAQLFCFEADWERADKQFDTLGQQNSELLVGTKLLRQLVRGEVARRQFYFEGRMPELVDDPDDRITAVLEALLLLREGQPKEALEMLKPLHQQTETLAGQVNGKPFQGGRDLDDVIGGHFEVLTTNGKFYWLPMDQVIELEFRGYERLQDRIWRSATIRVQGFTTEGEVYLPVNYCCDPTVWESQANDEIKLGRKTDWYAVAPEAPVRGMGQKTYVFGDQMISMLELESYRGPLAESE